MSNLLEGNKLIAEFMKLSVDVLHGDLCYADWDGMHSVKYHESWDWLKPVVDKIFTYALAYPEQVDKIRNISIVVEISPCWEACVKFITWLNSINTNGK